MVECSECHRTKKPVGRSAPMTMDLCDNECSGYYLEPIVSSLWWNESEADFGYSVGEYGTRISEPTNAQ